MRLCYSLDRSVAQYALYHSKIQYTCGSQLEREGDMAEASDAAVYKRWRPWAHA